MLIAGLKRSLVLVTAAAVALVAIGGGTPAHAAIVPTVQLGTAAQYAVLAGSTVTNTGNTVMDASLGLYPGTSVTGFPPGQVNAPGVQEITSPAAQTAQSDLTAAFVDAANRPLDATTPADLVNQILVGGVYAGPSKSPLSLSGPLVLDGAGDPTSVFILQTDSTLITASSSTVTLINGAQECNVFWLVGSSATLGTGSVFRGNILALDSITVTSGVTVYGRALARNAAVTLDDDTFVRPTCATTPVQGGATTVPGSATTTPGSATTTPGSATTTPGSATTTPGAASTLPGDAVTTQPGTFDTATTSVTDSTAPSPSFPGVTLPRTGATSSTRNIFGLGVLAVLAGVLVIRFAGRRPITGR